MEQLREDQSMRIYKVTAPLTGTFYQAASPEEPPFAAVGQKVQEGDIVCIIESMKVFTELRAEQGGTVINILVEDEDAVMRNQEIIEIAMA
jgi:acetyl-CoA carboxylase biotin carboxyl carrier protein